MLIHYCYLPIKNAEISWQQNIKKRIMVLFHCSRKYCDGLLFFVASKLSLHCADIRYYKVFFLEEAWNGWLILLDHCANIVIVSSQTVCDSGLGQNIIDITLHLNDDLVVVCIYFPQILCEPNIWTPKNTCWESQQWEVLTLPYYCDKQSENCVAIPKGYLFYHCLDVLKVNLVEMHKNYKRCNCPHRYLSSV